MKDPAITPELIDKHGITPEEYEHILEILGREPNFTELGIFSVMWSEHCSYKNSRAELKKFPTEGDKILVKAGEENAGVLDIGGTMAVCFKIESHNHPSAVEPFQGAATGVGGILRDIFTMGARPVANLNSLRFGPIRGDSPEAKRNRVLLAGVVEGIAHYGNCIGVPTVGGEVVFDPSYNGNPLVNAFNLGILRHDQIRRGAASGVGNPVFYVGAKTGRDGLAGAAFASRDLTEESKEDRPAVQVGDPFMEKLLLEACLELFEHPEAVVGVQDMGAAGLTCSTIETASRGGSGIEVDLNLVPQRETGMTPYEIMLSESQERMLIIVKKGFEDEVRRIFAKWDLDAAEIGYVTDTGRTVIKVGDEVVADVPSRELADDAPLYHREVREPAGLKELQSYSYEAEFPTSPAADELSQQWVSLMGSPSLASKEWVYRQYDHQVQKNTVLVPGGDAAVIRIETDGGGERFIAMAADCNGRYCSLDPRRGSMIAVAESARNCTMSGALPIGCTDNLNFGNPHDPEVFWQFRESVEGLSEACRAFETPVTGGNVSLYNKNPKCSIDPTPVMAMVGLIEERGHITPSDFQSADHDIVLVGGEGSEMGASAYLYEIHGIKKGMPPEMNLEAEVKFQNAVRAVIHQGMVKSAHDISDGGLALALAESAIAGGIGFEVDLSGSTQRSDVLLFNETQGRAVLTVEPAQTESLLQQLQDAGIAAQSIGKTTEAADLQIKLAEATLSQPLTQLKAAYDEAIPAVMH
ncbi:MAG: phosphoribosylformylglycinamidine synthase subunit PurL [Verrucomicrobiota bacterium]